MNVVSDIGPTMCIAVPKCMSADLETACECAWVLTLKQLVNVSVCWPWNSLWMCRCFCECRCYI